MIINPNNIEKWCFDYFEGNLTSFEKIEFERFILEHPEFHAEFEAWKSASESDDEKVPAYFGAEALMVGAPFYATWSFRVGIGMLLLLSLGAVGYYQTNLNGDERVYSSHENLVELGWNKANLDLAVVQFEDYTYGDYTVNIAPTYNSGNITSEYNEGQQNTDYVNADSELPTTNDLYSVVSFVEEALSSHHNDEDLLAYHNGLEVDGDHLVDKSLNTESYQEDDKTLFEHLGINQKKYQFLNFTNSRVKGLGSSKYDTKNKGGKSDNHATIIQNHSKGKTGGHKKKSSFFANLKHLELGLSNINDPISLSPNYNTLGVNPALAGQLGVTRIKMNVRNQWWSTEASVFKGSFYADTYFEKLQAGIAYGTEYDLSSNGQQIIGKHSFTYAQKFSVGENGSVSVGLTYDLSKGENSEVTPITREFYMNSPISSESLESKWKSNLGISTWYSGKFFFGGINVTNLLGNTFIATHEESASYFDNFNYSVQLGTDYKRSMFAKTVLSPYVQYDRMGDYKDLWLGSVVRIKGLLLGGSVATSKSAKAMLGLQGNKIRFTVSSDYSKSMLLDKYAFSHEVSLRILLGNKNNNWSRYDN